MQEDGDLSEPQQQVRSLTFSGNLIKDKEQRTNNTCLVHLMSGSIFKA